MKTRQILLNTLLAANITLIFGCAPKDNSDDLTGMVREIYVDNFSKGKVDVIDRYYATDFVSHAPGEADLKGPEAFKEYMKGALTVFPDFNVTIQDIVTQGDMIAFRWTLRGTQKAPLMGIPPTGKKIEVECISFYRAKEGKFVEKNYICDNLGMLQQLGAIPLPK